MEKKFTVQSAAPHVHADHARFETLRALLQPTPCWPDGTPRWKEPPKVTRSLEAGKGGVG